MLPIAVPLGMSAAATKNIAPIVEMLYGFSMMNRTAPNSKILPRGPHNHIRCA